MRVVIHGPNIGRGGTFHVHRAGCGDLRKRFYRDAESPMEYDAKTRSEIIAWVYADHIREAREAGDKQWTLWQSYESDFRFFPCLRGLHYYLEDDA